MIMEAVSTTAPIVLEVSTARAWLATDWKEMA